MLYQSLLYFLNCMPNPNPNYYQHLPNQQQHSDSSNRNNRIKLSHGSKILICSVVALIWFVVTHGKPQKVTSLDGLTHVESTLQYVFQTTIAVEKKRFIKRIVEESEGVWQYIPFANQPKWVDLEIQLTTRIGFDIYNHANSGFSPEGKIQIDVYEPTVLEKQWKTKIVDRSQYFFARWDIKGFEEKSHQLLEELAHHQSLHLLEGFKNDPKKMGQLAHRLEQRLEMKKSSVYSPIAAIDDLNRYVNSIFRSQSDESLTNIHSTYSTPQILQHKPQASPTDTRPKNPNTPRNNGSGRKSQQQKTIPAIGSRFKEISYSQQEQQMRREMKNQLNL